MTGNGPLGRVASTLGRAFRWPLLAAVIVGLLGFVVVYANAMSKDAVYEARVPLTVRPLAQKSAQQGSGDYVAIVTSNMPAVVELAGTRAVLQGTRDAVPGAPSEETIAGNTVVDLVPGSSVLRVSVTADTPQMASNLAKALTQQMIKQDIFAPVGKLTALDEDPPVASQKKPVAKVSKGMALLLGLALGVATFLAVAMLMPKVYSRRQLAHIVNDPTMPVFDLSTREGMNRVARLVHTFGGARSLVLGREDEHVRRALADRIPPLQEGDAIDVPVLVVVRRGDVRPNEVDGALGIAQRAGAHVVGVALS